MSLDGWAPNPTRRWPHWVTAVSSATSNESWFSWSDRLSSGTTNSSWALWVPCLWSQSTTHATPLDQKPIGGRQTVRDSKRFVAFLHLSCTTRQDFRETPPPPPPGSMAIFLLISNFNVLWYCENLNQLALLIEKQAPYWTPRGAWWSCSGLNPPIHNPSFSAVQLCGFGQIPQPLWSFTIYLHMTNKHIRHDYLLGLL